MDTELLPCPYCGNNKPKAAVAADGWGYVECYCGAYMSSENRTYTEDEAIKKWNTRYVSNDVVEYGGQGLKPNASFTLVGGEWVADNV